MTAGRSFFFSTIWKLSLNRFKELVRKGYGAYRVIAGSIFAGFLPLMAKSTFIYLDYVNK
jgi:hypothetical protein